MQIKTSDKALQKYIDHYWIVENCKALLGEKTAIYAYPGVTPEIIIVLDGFFKITYLGQTSKVTKSQVYAFIYDQVIIDLSTLNSFIIITFKPNGLASFLPFIDTTAEELMRNPISKVCDVLDPNFSKIEQKLKAVDTRSKADIINSWLSNLLDNEKTGFISDVISNLGTNCSPKEIMNFTNYSYSTLERIFKKEIGLTPKKYQSLLRYKSAVKEICQTKNTDWSYYVDKYNYFDQSHFAKEVKKYTSFTPSQLNQVKSLPRVRSLWS